MESFAGEGDCFKPFAIVAKLVSEMFARILATPLNVIFGSSFMSK